MEELLKEKGVRLSDEKTGDIEISLDSFKNGVDEVLEFSTPKGTVLTMIANIDYAKELAAVVIGQYTRNPDFAISNPEVYWWYIHEIDPVLVAKISDKKVEFASFLMDMKVIETEQCLYLVCWKYTQFLWQWIKWKVKIWASHLVTNDEMYCIWDTESDRDILELSIIFTREKGGTSTYTITEVEKLLKTFVNTLNKQ